MIVLIAVSSSYECVNDQETLQWDCQAYNLLK